MGSFTSTDANGYVVTNLQNQEVTDTDWVKYRVLTKDKSPIAIDASTTATSLVTTTEIKQYEKLALWNSTDGLKIIELGAVTYDGTALTYTTDITSAGLTTAPTNAHILTKRKDLTLDATTTATSLVATALLSDDTVMKSGETLVVYNSTDGYNKLEDITVTRSLSSGNVLYTVDISSLSLTAAPTEAYIIKPRVDVSFTATEDTANVNDIVLDVDTANTTTDVVKTLNYKENYNTSTQNRIKNTTKIDLDTGLAVDCSVTEVYQDPSSTDPFGDGSLILKYLLDGDATDLLGTYNGTEYGTPVYTTGKFGQCIDLDGVDDYIDTGYTHTGTAASVSFWCNLNDVTNRQFFIADIDSAGSDSDSTIVIEINRTAGQWATHMKGNIWDVISHNLVIGTWYHIVYTINSVDMSLYVNNTLIATYTFATALSDGVYTLKIGEAGDALTGYTNGKIDQVQIFNRALTADEVTQLYNEGKYKYDITLSTTQSSAPTQAIIRPTISDILSIDTTNTNYDSVNDLVEVYYNEINKDPNGFRCIQVKWESQQVSDENSKIQVDLWKT